MKWIAILILVTSIPAVAGAELEFHLCSEYVQESVVGEETPQGWPVYIKLTEVGTAHFASFTEANIGKLARITVEGRPFLRATIQAPIAGGVLHSVFASFEEATVWQKILSTALPTYPCSAD